MLLKANPNEFSIHENAIWKVDIRKLNLNTIAIFRANISKKYSICKSCFKIKYIRQKSTVQGYIRTQYKTRDIDKGHLISKGLFDVIVLTKKPTEFFKDFYPSL